MLDCPLKTFVHEEAPSWGAAIISANAAVLLDVLC